MANKWIDKDRFKKQQREAEKENQGGGYNSKKDVLQYGMKDRKTEECTITCRICPAVKDEIPENFSRTVYFHLIETGSGWKYVTCLSTYGEVCPICSVSRKLFMGDAQDKAQAQKLYRAAKKVCGIYVHQDPRDANRDNDDDKTTGRVMRLEYKKQIGDIIKIAGSDDEEKGIQDGIIDPSKDGYNFLLVVKEKITKNKQTGKEERYPTYAESCFSRKASPLAETEEEIEKILDSMFSLDEFLAKERTEVDVMYSILDSLGLLDLIKPEEDNTNKTNNKVKSESSDPEDAAGRLQNSGERVAAADQKKADQTETGQGLDKEDLDFLNDLELTDDDVPF